MNEIEEMKIGMVSKLITMLISSTPGLSMEDAMDEILNSDTYRKLINDSTGLYYQSAGYVYSFLEDEIKTGKAR